MDDGWTVIQSRGQFGNPVDYFHRNFKSYQDGFGVPGKESTQLFRKGMHSILHFALSIGEEHWLGLNHMFDMLQRKDYQLRIKMRTYDRVDKTALYDNFYLIDRVSQGVKDNYNIGHGLNVNYILADLWSSSR